MNYKKLLHIFTCSFMVFMMFSCGGDRNAPTDPSNPGGGNGKSYYIKHPWNSGGWEWRQMSASGSNTYTYTGVWGGVGANINTTTEDAGAEWYDVNKISGASSITAGTQVTFTFTPSNGNVGTLTVTPVGSGNPGGNGKSYYIKHPWNSGGWEWRQMSASGSNTYTYTGVWGGVGANINTTTSDNGAEWYDINKISGASSITAGTQVTFTFTPSNGNVGTLTVTSNGGGNPGGGNQGSVPSVPAGLSGSFKGSANTGFRVELSWQDVNEATSYNIYRSSSESGSYSKIGSSATYNYTDNNPLEGDNYYKVSAVNAKGESDKSNSIKVNVDRYAFKPDFKSVKGSISGGKVVVTWSTKSAEGYGKPETVELKIHDPNDDTWPSTKYTGSSASSGSHSWACSSCYTDGYGRIQVSLSVSNEYGTNTHNLTYANGSWGGNF